MSGVNAHQREDHNHTQGNDARQDRSGSDGTAHGTSQPQTLEAFLTKSRKAKRTLIEAILASRDLITLVGRRRHGKTLFIGNLGLSLAQGRADFLGYPIPEARQVVIFYLEDDEAELAEKLQKMRGDTDTAGRFVLYTKEDFLGRKIPIDVTQPNFQTMVRECCKAARPDLIIFDNLGVLISGDYMNHTRINTLTAFMYDLAQEYDAAVLLAVHPRKRSDEPILTLQDGPERSLLRSNPEKFFEACMGSSHTINSTGSLWGIERSENGAGERTCLLLGTQRRTGTQEFTTVEKDESEWFRPVSDFQENLRIACTTSKREDAWKKLPNTPFKFVEAVEIVKGIMSKSTFSDFFKELIRHNLVQPTGKDDSTYLKATEETYGKAAGK